MKKDKIPHKNPVLKKFTKQLEEFFDQEKINPLMEEAWTKYNSLCIENKDEIKAVKAHTFTKIYPAIAMYKTLIESGTSKEEAEKIMDKMICDQSIPDAKMIQTMMKIPGLHKKMPAIFASVTKNTFGEKAGFHADFYPTEKTQCKFDMTKCLYLDTCTKNGCPEITKCFCHTDDVTDGNMHPNLKWNRSKTMGEGGDCCDFDLFVIKH